MKSDLFHPAVSAWFDQSFARPTPAQADAWPAIKAGRDVLIAAPTGSGKTLAAFLCAIDALVRQGLDDGLKDETQIVYVSPLKALSNDIHRNLDLPLAGIRKDTARERPARCRDPVLGAHGRHAAGGASACREAPAAYRRDNAGVALHPARLGFRPLHAEDHARRDRGRDSCRGIEQARLASCAFA